MNINDLMNWTPDKQILAKETPTVFINHVWKYNRDHKYSITRVLTDSKKIDIINQHDKRFMPVLDLADKFQKEKDTIKKNYDGKINSVSYRAWLKRNDQKECVASTYYLGRVYNYDKDHYNHYYIATLGEPQNRQEFINKVFDDLLSKLRGAEFEYFLDHDEYTVLKSELRTYNHAFKKTFNGPLGFCSNGRILVMDVDSDAERDITMDELKTMISMYKQVEDFIAELSAKCDIKY